MSSLNKRSLKKHKTKGQSDNVKKRSFLCVFIICFFIGSLKGLLKAFERPLKGLSKAL